MKITMLGYTTTGKTCYMLGMYSFMSMGFRSFTINTQDYDEDLELSDKWDALVEDRVWPDSTQEGTEKSYKLDFCYGAKPILPFEWLDYRGGALRDNSSTSDVKRLIDYAKQSDCIFICISGEHLTEEIVDSSGAVNNNAKAKAARKSQTRRINKLIQDIGAEVKASSTKPFPIAIVITKYDLCMQRGKEAVIRDIKELLDPLFTVNSSWLTAIIPVSLGKDVASGGEINPLAIHLPVVFAVYIQLRNTASQLNLSRELVSGQLTDAKSRNVLIRWLNSSEIDNKEIRIKELESQFSDILQKMQLLIQELGKVPVYQGKDEVDINVNL